MYYISKNINMFFNLSFAVSKKRREQMHKKLLTLSVIVLLCISFSGTTNAQTPILPGPIPIGGWLKTISFTNKLYFENGNQFSGLMVKIKLAYDFAHFDGKKGAHDHYNFKTAAGLLTGYMHQMDAFANSGKILINGKDYSSTWWQSYRPWVVNMIWKLKHSIIKK